MSRENKLALIIGFGLVLVVGILVSDHFSAASTQQAADLTTEPQYVSQERLGDPHLLTMVPTERDEEPATVPLERAASAPLLSNGGHDKIGEHARSIPEGFVPVRPLDRAATYLRMPDQNDLLAQDLPATPPPSAADTLPSSYTLYTIQPNESLAKIARAHYGDARLWTRIAEFNKDRLPNPDVIRSGITIRLPGKGDLQGAASPQAREASVPPTTPPAPVGQYRSYLVQPGDILGEVSLKLLGTSKRWREIYELNRDVIADPDNVPAGVKLRIPIG